MNTLESIEQWRIERQAGLTAEQKSDPLDAARMLKEFAALSVSQTLDLVGPLQR